MFAPSLPDPGRVRDVLTGLAVGEAYGLPYALSGERPRSPASLEPLMLGGVAAYGAATEQAAVLAAVLAESCGFNPDLFARRLSSAADLENPIRLYSLPTVEDLMLIRRGVPWGRARSLVASLEPALDAVARAAPIALFYTKERLVAEMAMAQALATTLDTRTAAAARAYAVLLYHLLHGAPVEEALEHAASQTPKASVREALLQAAELAAEPPETRLRVASRPGDAVSGLLQAAAAALASLEQGPREALWLAVTAAPEGSAHLAAAMAGALLAAAGASPQPPAPLEAEAMIAAASERLAAAITGCRGLERREAVAGSS